MVNQSIYVVYLPWVQDQNVRDTSKNIHMCNNSVVEVRFMQITYLVKSRECFSTTHSVFTDLLLFIWKLTCKVGQCVLCRVSWKCNSPYTHSASLLPDALMGKSSTKQHHHECTGSVTPIHYNNTMTDFGCGGPSMCVHAHH